MIAQPSFGSRLLDWTSLDTALRRVIAVSVALLLGLALSTAVRDAMPGTSIVASGYVLPLVALVIAGLSVATALTFLIAGIAQARSSGRFAAIIGLAGLSAALVFASGGLVPHVEIPVLLFFVALSALVIFGNAIGWHSTLAIAAALIAAFAGYTLVVGTLTGFAYTAYVVIWTLVFLVVILAPVLAVVGWDLAEIATDISSWTLRRLPARPLVAAVLIVASVALALWLHGAHGMAAANVLFFRTGALAVAGLALAWALTQLPAPKHYPHVNYVYVLIPAVALLGADWSGTLFTKPPPDAYNASQPHRFSVTLPAGWRLVSDTYAGKTKVSYKLPRTVVLGPAAPLPRFVVMAVPRDVDGVRQPTALDLPVGLGSSPASVPFEFDKTNSRGWTWGHKIVKDQAGADLKVVYEMKRMSADLPIANANWYRACIWRDKKDGPACRDISRSFQFEEKTQADPQAAALFNEFLWMAVAVVALVGAAFSPASFLIFLAWVATAIVVRNAGASGLDFHLAAVAVAPALSADLLAATLLVGAIALFVADVEGSRRATPGADLARNLALSFLATVFVLAVLFVLYLYAAQGSEHSNEIRGAIVCLVLIWEFVTSGAVFTNRDSGLFPRPARILFYLGYLILVATVVFFWVKIDRAIGERPQAPFEAEIYVAAGIVCLGLPYIFYQHVALWLAARARPRRARLKL